jgi:hypothetical protein
MSAKFNLIRGLVLLFIAFLIKIHSIDGLTISYVLIADAVLTGLIIMGINRDRVDAYAEIFLAIISIIVVFVVLFETTDKVIWYRNFMMHKFWTGIQLACISLSAYNYWNLNRKRWYWPVLIVMGTAAITIYTIVNHMLSFSNVHIYSPMLMIGGIYLLLALVSRFSRIKIEVV